MTRAILAVSAAIALALPAHARSKSVQCQDGTTSKSGRGACSHHGGVADSGTASAPSKSKSKARSKTSDANASNSDQSNDASKSKRSKQPAQSNDAAASNQGSEPGFFGRLMGRSAPAPRRKAPAQQGAPTARCNDGTTSYSQHHSGTCSGHGGVAQWLDQQ
jgi:Protein of unknown function (DUF3761)